MRHTQGNFVSLFAHCPRGHRVQLCANSLFLADLWYALDDINVRTNPAAATLASRLSALWAAWWLVPFALANIFGFCFAAWMLAQVGAALCMSLWASPIFTPPLLPQHLALAIMNQTTNEVRGSPDTAAVFL